MAASLTGCASHVLQEAPKVRAEASAVLDQFEAIGQDIDRARTRRALAWICTGLTVREFQQLFRGQFDVWNQLCAAPMRATLTPGAPPEPAGLDQSQ